MVKEFNSIIVYLLMLMVLLNSGSYHVIVDCVWKRTERVVLWLVIVVIGSIVQLTLCQELAHCDEEQCNNVN